ncbi:MAG: Fe-S cluster assembly protein SufD [Proteobacteria bacterium]|nr:Fe-S cluster assembly protein SufD [Pseudomonadota bacterium]
MNNQNIEDWKYTNIEALLKTKYNIPKVISGDASIKSQIQSFLFSTESSITILFQNGQLNQALSNFKEESELEIAELKDSKLSASEVQTLQEITASLKDNEICSYQNTLPVKGMFIRAKKSSSKNKIVNIVYLQNNNDEADLVSPVRNLIIAEENSNLKVVETFISNTDIKYLSNPLTQIICKSDAIVEHNKVLLEGKECVHLGLLQIVQAANSHFISNYFAFGGKTIRNEIHPILAGEHENCLLNGLTVIKGEQHVDNFTVIDHSKPNCFSREIYKGIYADKSTGAFSGTIIVRQDAQKTNAIQSNKSLLLSDDATINSRPQLKIYADDVKCTHGATVGQLDEDSMFYLRARGIGEKDARNMLINAFASDTLEHITIDELKEILHLEIDKALA